MNTHNAIEAYKFLKQNKKETGVGSMIITMRHGDKIISRMSFTNDCHAKQTFDELIKENEEEGYKIVNRRASRVEMFKGNVISRLFQTPIVIEIE